MELSEAVTLAGATILISILVEVLKRALAWGAAQVDRFGPLVSIVIGVIVVVLLTAAQGEMVGDAIAQVIAVAVITGILSGAAASGLYDTVKVVT